MKNVLAIAAVALALLAPISAADAHSARYHVRQHYGHVRMWNAPVAMYQNRGPRWAQPNECYTDLGYGRYESCDR